MKNLIPIGCGLAFGCCLVNMRNTPSAVIGFIGSLIALCGYFMSI